MKKGLVLTVCVVLLLAAITAAVLAASYQRVVVVEGIGGTPIPGAHVTLQRSSGSPEEVGRTDANGRLVFWIVPLPVPRTICAQSTFYPTTCVSAISLSPHLIELPVPASAP
jgi:hypothetical protein